MSQLIKQLQLLEADRFVSEDDEEYQVQLLPGLTDEQVRAFAESMPQGRLSADIQELLLFTRGFEFSPLEEILFDAFNQFGLEELFPNSIQLAGDGFGNFWILDINQTGQWGSVFYVCHDPAVIIRQSTDLCEFLRHIQEFGKLGADSWLDQVHGQISSSIWLERKTSKGMTRAQVAKVSSDAVVRQFSSTVPADYLIADLRVDSPILGFAWDTISADGTSKVRKHTTEPIWAFEPALKRSWLSRWFKK
ncbi:hypothetical protein GCM10011375_06720 [Hymenobacter qilianensis]|uniref:Uncharacterized protein n=2 Tax=Hymenobacter qilianensis TaxID=1385715 RepID=A0ACB5PMP9_9BACT|nr:SMI1/KNR4 family protein [Hymenobacter qilianensis]QNP53680.1 SMI1/KNR4 family protein [Hymenobacter qilianensis]GGF53924.1 hypothetical protein GCM10011375_06720 [Hymenobacter qilianensis]